MSPERIRLIGLLGSAAFTSAVVLAVRPPKDVLILTLAPSFAFALADLAIEYAAFGLNIWICRGSPQVLHVPIVMLASFFIGGIGCCLLIYVLVRYRRGIRLGIDVATFVTVVGLILFLLEFVWRDYGVTTYAKPYTPWCVLAAWQTLLWVLVGGFLWLLHRFLGFENVMERRERIAETESSCERGKERTKGS